MTSALPFDDFRALLGRLPQADEASAHRHRVRIEAMGAAGRGLGGVAELGEWLATWTDRPASVQRPLVALFAGTHGITPEFAKTAAFVEHCAAGGTAVSQICGVNDLGLKVFDLALDVPTEDITRDAALDERGCAATMAFGMEAIAGGFDLLAIGGFGTGGAVASRAVLAACGFETAPDERVSAALAFHGQGNLRDPFEIVRRVGGREIAALVGVILAARSERIPVVLDGLAALAAGAVLEGGSRGAIAHCRLAASTGQADFDAAAKTLGLEPLVGFAVDQPGVGAALGASTVKAAAQAVSVLKTL